MVKQKVAFETSAVWQQRSAVAKTSGTQFVHTFAAIGNNLCWSGHVAHHTNAAHAWQGVGELDWLTSRAEGKWLTSARREINGRPQRRKANGWPPGGRQMADLEGGNKWLTSARREIRGRRANGRPRRRKANGWPPGGRQMADLEDGRQIADLSADGNKRADVQKYWKSIVCFLIFCHLCYRVSMKKLVFPA